MNKASLILRTLNKKNKIVAEINWDMSDRYIRLSYNARCYFNSRPMVNVALVKDLCRNVTSMQFEKHWGCLFINLFIGSSRVEQHVNTAMLRPRLIRRMKEARQQQQISTRSLIHGHKSKNPSISQRWSLSSDAQWPPNLGRGEGDKGSNLCQQLGRGGDGAQPLPAVLEWGEDRAQNLCQQLGSEDETGPPNTVRVGECTRGNIYSQYLYVKNRMKSKS